ncbi:hypothetical protein HOO54_08620 [Bacillus sp. WMMC1349]|uniref:hypothetical protein n=1 Tax=Bacillus sp. WMMC1349 TaxID=2736254 RepID=UPI001556E1A5|nr:hypothetical protein [Bacillus sp. WMMC1349]NPC92283.1 hypothetical protein [Bacillus sp. WMMC1349]
MVSRKVFYFVGVLLFFNVTVRVMITIITDTFSIVEVLPWGAMTFMSFAMGYLQPQLLHKDERMEHIKQKTMQYSLVTTMVYIFFMMIGTQSNLLMLTAEEVLSILMALIVIAVWFIWIVVAKQN